MATEHCDKVAAGVDPGLSLSGKSSGRGTALFCNSSVPGLSRSCNSSDKAIAFLGACRAHLLARWHRFVSIERREPLQTSLQGTSARAMISRKNPDMPHTAVRARSHTFQNIIWHGNRHSRCLQAISACAMAPICVHRAPRTPPDSTPGHIRSRDGTDLCPSSTANPSRHRSKAHPPAR